MNEQQPKILIVDDQSANLFAMKKVLGKLDCEIFTAESGNVALSLTLHHNFALILLDVQMPKMDGFEVASLVRDNQATKTVPIVFVTAISKETAHVFKGYESGAVDYLFKPVDADILRAKVKVFLELHRQKQALQAENFRRRLAEEVLSRYAAKLHRNNRELEQFAYVASHDMKEPLQMVASNAQLLAEKYEGKLDGEADRWIHHVTEGAERLRELIENLLEYSRIGATEGPFRPVDLQEAVDLALTNLNVSLQETNARIDVDKLCTIRGSEPLLIQLFQNLIANALKFRGSSQPVVKISCELQGNDCRISVQDNGIGIDPQYSKYIFRLFQRLHSGDAYPGTGIGLAACEKIVAHHGGSIWVNSELGQGATFHVTLRMGRISEPAEEELVLT